MTVKMRAMANRTDLMRAILFGAPPVTLAIFKLANCCFCCSRADLSSVLDCDRRSDVFTWDPVVEIQKGENCCVSTKELFLRDEGKRKFRFRTQTGQKRYPTAAIAIVKRVSSKPPSVYPSTPAVKASHRRLSSAISFFFSPSFWGR